MGELRSKYGNHRLWIDGKRFDSQAEATRFRELQLLERAGEIEVLLHHPRFALVVNGVKIGTYEADAGYIDHGERVAEDTKGLRTPVYKLKAKLMRALYGITIREVQA